MTTQDGRGQHERRTTERFSALGGFQVQVASTNLPLVLLDISTAGFAVQSPVDFKAGVTFEFRFMPANAAALFVRAINVHCLQVMDRGKRSYVAGFSFSSETVAASRPQIERLVDLVATNQKHHALTER